MSQTESFSNHNDLEKKSTLDLLILLMKKIKKYQELSPNL